MLPSHLIVKTAPVADPGNVYFFKDYRITVLFDRLFRIEKNETKNFCDDATQSIWYRNMPRVSTSVCNTDEYIEIKTDRVTLHLADTLPNSYVTVNGKNVPINNDGNLFGTTRTLDCYDGDIHIKSFAKLELAFGVCSRSGVAVLDDKQSLRLMDGGKLAPASDCEIDVYVFAYGNEYREAVRALYAISGATPLLPRYAFGNWWSRYHAYSADEYLWLMDKFKEYGIPFTVATVDMDWHYSDDLDEQKQITASGKISEHHGTVGNFRLGWTGYSWNKELFPDYKAFLRELKERDLKVTLNLHPADGVRYFEDMYEQMAIAMGIDPKTEQAVKFDIANDDFIKAYFEILHHPYEKDGVDFFGVIGDHAFMCQLLSCCIRLSAFAVCCRSRFHPRKSSPRT
jgi:alpha-glucosidase (family GH31 glycosyl hydrolase)